MKQIKNLFFLLAAVFLAASCTKQIRDKQTDPNNPTTVTPKLILGTVLDDISGIQGSSTIGSLGGVNSWDNVQRWNQYHCSNYSYYNDNIYSWTDGSLNSDGSSDGPFSSYIVLKNVVQMEGEAAKILPALNPYEAVGRFVRAYYYYNMTSLLGDVPVSQALEGLNNLTPTYTPQEQVYAYVLAELDTANSDFAALIAAANVNNTLDAAQDLYYQGNLVKWQKLVNSFELRVLVSLSPKASDAVLNVPARFSKILSTPGTYPIFAGQSDDFQFVYNPGNTNTYSTYPYNPSNFGSLAGRLNMANTYVSSVASLNDPRVFITCEPAWAKVDTAEGGSDTLTGVHATDFSAFVGASTGEAIGDMYNNANNNLYSNINRYRYYSNFTGEPDVLIGYKEMCFNIAEGITRGWWTGGNAETWYKAGITNSMSFYGIDVTQTSFTAHFLPPANSSVTQVVAYPFTFNWTTYYAQSSVALSTTAATAINQIVLQKYIACFENSGYEGYYNYRRTGVPAFDGGSGVGNNGVVPKRWAYPVTEQVQNVTNWKAALANQGFTADDLNQTIWLLK